MFATRPSSAAMASAGPPSVPPAMSSLPDGNSVEVWWVGIGPSAGAADPLPVIACAAEAAKANKHHKEAHPRRPFGRTAFMDSPPRDGIAHLKRLTARFCDSLRAVAVARRRGTGARVQFSGLGGQEGFESAPQPSAAECPLKPGNSTPPRPLFSSVPFFAWACVHVSRRGVAARPARSS